MRRPGIRGFLRGCLYYSHNRFLCVPGFGASDSPSQAVRLECIRHAIEWTGKGELPPAIPQERMRGISPGPLSILDYYRSVYGRCRDQSQRIRESLNALVVAAG